MAAKGTDRQPDWLPDRLHLAAFERAPRAHERVDHDLYAPRAHGERARALSRALHATSRTLARTIGRGLLDPMRRWRRARRTYAELMALDDRMLRDIGIRRDDIEAIARERWRPQGRGQSAAVEQAFKVKPTKEASAGRPGPEHREAA